MKAALLSLGVLLTACGQQTRNEPQVDADTEVTTTVVSPIDRPELAKRAAEGDGAAAYLLWQEDGDLARLDRAVEAGWPPAFRDKAIQIVRAEGCRRAEGERLFERWRTNSEVPPSADEVAVVRRWLDEAAQRGRNC